MNHITESKAPPSGADRCYCDGGERICPEAACASRLPRDRDVICGTCGANVSQHQKHATTCASRPWQS